MRVAPDLGIPEEKPAIESLRGHWEQKISPQRKHALLQYRIAAVLTAWAGERGEVGTEWRCYMLPSGEPPSSLVPDVAYFSFERLPRELDDFVKNPRSRRILRSKFFLPTIACRCCEKKSRSIGWPDPAQLSLSIRTAARSPFMKAVQ